MPATTRLPKIITPARVTIGWGICNKYGMWEEVLREFINPPNRIISWETFADHSFTAIYNEALGVLSL